MKVATKLIREGQSLVKKASCLFTPSPVFITGAFFSSDFAYRLKNKNDKKETLLNKEVLFNGKRINEIIHDAVQSVCTL